ncbi:MAG TPA: HEAT repeat domain-containing protein [Blastocatellia bacterium]|nr:HEAT repeat domain-containing protein [Blastocatellia bacterium]
MRRSIASFLSALVVTAFVATTGAAQRDRFINVEGSDLRSRIESAIRMARSSSTPTSFWVAYAFDVRPGVSVDVSYSDSHGTTYVSGTSVNFDDDTGKMVETRNLGVFLLHESGGSPIIRVEVYNLDRPREYSRYPVYWAGRAGNQESLNLLKNLAMAGERGRVSKTAAMAIGLHDDPSVGSLLKELVRNASDQEVRKSAVFWLGMVPGEQAFLTELVRNEQEPTELRKQAAFAIGVGKDASALVALQGLYPAVTSREVKKQIIFASSINRNSDQAVDFLVKVASDDPDRELRKQALFWLGQKAGKRALEVLGKTVESADAETEVQKHAVFAISQRPRDESIPLLIKIARTHAKPEVRKQAIFWLGQTGDERALAFFKEILSK